MFILNSVTRIYRKHRKSPVFLKYTDKMEILQMTIELTRLIRPMHYTTCDLHFNTVCINNLKTAHRNLY